MTKSKRTHRLHTHLTPRQQAFVEQFLKSGDGKAAAIAVGYKISDAASNASRILRLPKVKKMLDQARAKSIAHASYNLETAHAEMSRLLEISVNLRQMTAASRFAELKAKLHGLLVEKVDHRMLVPVSINIQGFGGTPAAISPPIDVTHTLLPPATAPAEIQQAFSAPEDKNLEGFVDKEIKKISDDEFLDQVFEKVEGLARREDEAKI